MPELKPKPLGELAYNGYRDHTGGKTWNGYDMPHWADLPPHVQAAWNTATSAVRRDTLAEVITMLQAEVAS